MNLLPKGRSFSTTPAQRLHYLTKGRSSIANSGTKVAVLQGVNRCGTFLLLSAPHSLFCIWPDLKRSQKIPWTPRWEESFWLIGPSVFHRNSPQGLNFSSIRVLDQIRDTEILITIRPQGIHHHHQCVLPKGRPLTASAETQAAVLPKAGFPLQTQDPRLQFHQG